MNILIATILLAYVLSTKYVITLKYIQLWQSQGLIKDGIIHNVRVAPGKTVLSNESGADIANYNMQVISGNNLT